MLRKISVFLVSLFVCFLTFLPATVWAANESTLKPPPGSIGTDVSPESIPQLVVNILFYVGGILALAYLMYGGIRYITSRGERAQVEAAKKHLTAAIIGLIIVAGAFFIIKIVFTVLGAENPLAKGFQLPTLNNLK